MALIRPFYGRTTMTDDLHLRHSNNYYNYWHSQVDLNNSVNYA